MSESGNSVTDKAGEIARNIWLAGIGAYGRAVEEAQQPPGGTAGGSTSGLFRDLVRVGVTLEEQALEDKTEGGIPSKQPIQRPALQHATIRAELVRLNRRLDTLQKTLNSVESKLDALAHARKD